MTIGLAPAGDDKAICTSRSATVVVDHTCRGSQLADWVL